MSRTIGRRVVPLLTLLAAAACGRDVTGPSDPPSTPLLSANGKHDGGIAQVGRQVFFDENLSIRRNQSCASCHDPAFVFSSPDVRVNAHGGVVPGSLGSFAFRHPPSAAYNSLSPVLAFSVEDDAWITWIIVGLAAIYAAIAVVNTVVMAVSQRRRELALVRLAGATPRQALAMIRNEAVATTLVAVAGGGLVATAAGLGVARAYPGGHLAMVPLIGVAIVGADALVGVGSATIAARIALRRPPRPVA